MQSDFCKHVPLMRKRNPNTGQPLRQKSTEVSLLYASSICLLVPLHFEFSYLWCVELFKNVRRPWAVLHCHRRVSTALMSPSMDIAVQTKRTNGNRASRLDTFMPILICSCYSLHACAALEDRPWTRRKAWKTPGFRRGDNHARSLVHVVPWAVGPF